MSTTAAESLPLSGRFHDPIMSTTLPVLAPRLPGCPPAVDDRTYTKEHTEEEWEAMREVIKRLYIRDNRKLNETMAILQARHGFAAT